MRLRFALLVGFAIGYVLGARAGRERYDQIMRVWAQVRRSDPAQQISAEARSAAARAGHAIEQKASEGVAKVTQLVHREEGDGQKASQLPPS